MPVLIVYNGAYFKLLQSPLGTDVHYQGYAMLRLTSVCVFLFSALALAVNSGYSLGAVLLLLSSTALLWQRPRLDLQRRDYLILGTLLFYFLIFTVNMLYHGDPTRELDMPLRALLAIPVMLLLLAYPPHPAAWWGGVACGAIAGAGVAIWQMIALGEMRPYAATSNAIHYGNASMLLGLLSVSGLGWAQEQRHATGWSLLLVLGCLAGIFGSIASGSRGGWIAIPVFTCIFVAHHARQRGKRYLQVALAVVVVLVGIAFAAPQSLVRERTLTALTEVRKFENTGNVDTSIGQRIEMWRTALSMSDEHVFLGIGRNGYLAQKEDLVAAGRMSTTVRDYTNAHNDYLDALVKRGSIGLLALLAFLLVPLYMFAGALRQGTLAMQHFSLAGVALCTCYLIFGLTTTSLTLNIGIIMLVFPMVILWALLRHQERTS
ncbi:MAG: O-antigen ligase family protein [Janthinobacterium sp.]|nr:O-antigen ligase family protein [Janthinobacterium sp.]